MATDEDRREEYRIEALIERAIRRGTLVECNSCGGLTTVSVVDEDDPLIEYGNLCKKCRQGIERNEGI